MNILKNLLTKTGLNNPIVAISHKPEKIYRYGGDMKDRVVGYCYRCKEEHDLPAAQWYIVQKKKKTHLVCLDSLTFEELKSILNSNTTDSEKGV